MTTPCLHGKTTCVFLAVFLLSSVDLRAADFVVSNRNDSGPGSLRQAVIDAAAGGTNNRITFSVDGEILLTSEEIFYNSQRSLSITGNGVAFTSISGNNARRVFHFGDSAGDITLTHMSIHSGNIGGGSAGDGGGIFSSSRRHTSLSHVILNSNIASDDGSAIYFKPALGNATASFDHVIVQDNRQDDNGAVCFERTTYDLSTGDTWSVQNATFTDCVFRNNNNTSQLGSGGYRGGALYLTYGNFEFFRCTFNDNEANAGGEGGAVYMSRSTASFQNCTISGNSSSGSGAGLFINNFSTATLNNCTLVNNTAGYVDPEFGGGFYVANGEIILHNTIVLGNKDNVSGDALTDDGGRNATNGTITSAGFNIVGVGTITGFTPTTGDQTHSNPAVVFVQTLENNGGVPDSVPTHRLLEAGPAIDAAELGGIGSTPTAGALHSDDNTIIQVDARGFGRAQGTHRGDALPDVGAYESFSTRPPAEADLSVTITDSPDPVIAGETLTYTVTVANAGPDPAVDVQVTATLPAGVTLVSTSGAAEDPNGVPTASLGTISRGSSAQVTVVVMVGPSTSGTLTNMASVSSIVTDPEGGNNSASEDTEAIMLQTVIRLAGNNLVVDDVVAGDDNLTIQYDDGTMSFSITDPGQILGTSLPGATGSGTNTLTIPTSAFSGGIIFNGMDGDDHFTVDFTMGTPPVDITFHGGNQNTSPGGDSLSLTGGGFAATTYSFSGPGAGSVGDGVARIFFTGLE